MGISASASEAYGIAAFGDLTITGGGNISTEAYGDSDTSYAIVSTGNIDIEDSVGVFASAYSPNDTPKNIYGVICSQLTVKDSASLDTSWGENSSGIGIWDGGDIIVGNSASIAAYGGIILFGNEEKKPGAIRASGDSTVTVVCEHEGDGTDESENVLNWGITGAPNKENAPEDAIADIVVTDNAAVSVSVAAENGGAVYKAKAANGVAVTGGRTADDSNALEYKGDTYKISGTEDTALYALFEKSDEPEPTTTPKPSNGGGGFKSSSSSSKPTASPDPTSAPDGTATPEATENPAATATPEATGQPEATSAPATDSLPFVDVTASDWFFGAVKSVYSEGLMSGVTETEFAPNMNLTRGMLVTIIGRAGAAEASSSSSFTDVAAGAYYAPYVAWAAENGIVTGFGDGTFRPDEIVTREQTAAILRRYMKYIGADVSVGENTNIPVFTDASDISEYAVPAIQWACGAGVINGYTDGSLAPKSGITRAEFAVMISKTALY